MKAARVVLATVVGAALAIAAVANADAPDAGAPDPSGSAYAEPVGPSCVPHVPDGAVAPTVVEDFPNQAMSGYAALLTLKIRHGKGETVLPDGLHVVKQGDGAKALSAAGFAIPETDGGTGPTITTEEASGDWVTTTLVVPVVPLAPKAGRNFMTLPPLPVAVSRANGELVTLCTKSHMLRVEEPIARERDPKVKQNPPGRAQREEWVFLEELLAVIAIGLVVAGLIALLARWWRRRPREAVPVVRPIPWDVAMAELAAIRRSNLLSEHRNDEYFDRVSDTIRRYLGARYHFDALEAAWSGIETTTDEMKALLRRVTPPITAFGTIVAFLNEADLVKFARVFPSETECEEALRRAEDIVRGTIPPAVETEGNGPAVPPRGNARADGPRVAP